MACCWNDDNSFSEEQSMILGCSWHAFRMVVACFRMIFACCSDDVVMFCECFVACFSDDYDMFSDDSGMFSLDSDMFFG